MSEIHVTVLAKHNGRDSTCDRSHEKSVIVHLICAHPPFLALRAGPERVRCDVSEIHVHRAATQFSSITVAC